MKITLEANPSDAPCCVKVIAEDSRDLLVQTDYEFCGIASTFGWSPSRVKAETDDPEYQDCEHQSTDGTVNCPTCGTSASLFIQSARQWIDDNDGAEVEDPGYFDHD